MGSQISCTSPEDDAAQPATRVAPTVSNVRGEAARRTASVPAAAQTVRDPGPKSTPNPEALEITSTSSTSVSDGLDITPAPLLDAHTESSAKSPTTSPISHLVTHDSPSSSIQILGEVSESRANIGKTRSNASSNSHAQDYQSHLSIPLPFQSSPRRRSQGTGDDITSDANQTRIIRRQSAISAIGELSHLPKANTGRKLSLPTSLKWPTTSGSRRSDLPPTTVDPETTSDEVFYKFPDFPIEIRLLIFRYCAFIPRIVPLYYPFDDHNHVYSNHPAPPILQVCTEARLEASKFYSRAFGTKSLFNLMADTVFIENPIGVVFLRNDNLFTPAYHPVRTTPSGDPTSCLLPLLRLASKEELLAIRYLAVGCNIKAFPKDVPPTWTTIGAYRHLKEKTLPNLESVTFALEMNKLPSGKAARNMSSFEQVQDRKREIGRGLEISFLPLKYDEAWKERAKTYIEAAVRYCEWENTNAVVANLWVDSKKKADNKALAVAAQHELAKVNGNPCPSAVRRVALMER